MTQPDDSGAADPEHAIAGALSEGDIAGALEGVEQALRDIADPARRYRLHVIHARLLSVVGEINGAMQAYTAALETASADLERGVALLGRGELAEMFAADDDARRDLEAALELLTDQADRASALQARGRIERDRGDLLHAIDLLTAARDTLMTAGAATERIAEATLDLAMALRLAGRVTAAIDLLEGLVESAESAFAARILIQIGTTYGFAGDSDRALAAYARALPLLPEATERAIVRYNRAVVLRERGDLAAAMEEIERALLENAGQDRRVEFDALLLAGMIARELHDAPRSLDLLREASEREPDGDAHGRARLEVGTTLAATGLYGPAIDEFGIAVALCESTTDRARALRYRGMARHELGLIDAAIDDFEAAIAMTDDPDERARGLSTLAPLLVAVGRRADARNALAGALQYAIDGGLRRQLHVQRGALLSELGDLDGAASDLEHAATMADAAGDTDTLARVLADLGAIHLARDAYSASREALERAAELAGSGPVATIAYLHLGQLHVTLGAAHAATKAFESAAAAAEDDRDARANAFLARGSAALRWGWYAQAYADLTRVVALGPSAELVDRAAIALRTTEHHLSDIARTRDELTNLIAAEDHASYRAQPMLQRGLLALAAGDTDTALQDVLRSTRLFRLRPERAQAFGHLALVHAHLGQCADALAAIAEADALDPSRAWATQLAGHPDWDGCRHVDDFPTDLLPSMV